MGTKLNGLLVRNVTSEMQHYDQAKYDSRPMNSVRQSSDMLCEPDSSFVSPSQSGVSFS